MTIIGKLKPCITYLMFTGLNLKVKDGRFHIIICTIKSKNMNIKKIGAMVLLMLLNCGGNIENHLQEGYSTKTIIRKSN